MPIVAKELTGSECRACGGLIYDDFSRKEDIGRYYCSDCGIVYKFLPKEVEKSEKEG